jgi:hypothetical protein
MATVFQNILANAQRKGITDQYAKDSIAWYRTNIRKTFVAPSRVIREEKDNYVTSWTQVGMGKLYFAYYDPKHKETLPHYDLFPLIIPFRRYNDGFLGLNLHYLPPAMRAKLLDGLYDTLTNARLDENKKFAINYQLLKSVSTLSYFKPCVKRYLGSHFRSRFVKVPHDRWTAAVFLPVEDFQKQSKNEVWAESRKIATRGNAGRR